MSGTAALRKKLLALAVGGLAAPWFGGCMMNQPNARYIYQDGEYGVIGVPQNSPFGFKNYEQQARDLMARHFPDGYEIVRADEVVAGQRILDRNRSRQLETEPAINALDQQIKLGRLAETSSTQQKDSLSITESRIIYHRRLPGRPPGPNGFTVQASLAPELYVDPNELIRARNFVEIAEAKMGKSPASLVAAKTPEKPKPAAPTSKTADPAVQKAAAAAPK